MFGAELDSIVDDVCKDSLNAEYRGFMLQRERIRQSVLDINLFAPEPIMDPALQANIEMLQKPFSTTRAFIDTDQHKIYVQSAEDFANKPVILLCFIILSHFPGS